MSLTVSLFATVAAAVPVTEAGAHFFGAPALLGGYNRDVSSGAGAVTFLSQVSTPPGAPLSSTVGGRVRASIQSLGIELGVTNAGGSVGATIFEGVRFLGRELPTPANTLAGYSIGLIGRISGRIDQNVSFFDPQFLDDGDPLPGGSGVRLTYFETLEDRDAALGRGGATGATQTLASFRAAGPIDLRFEAPMPDPTPPPFVPPEVVVINANAPYVPCDQGGCNGIDIAPTLAEDLRVASFGLGLAFNGSLFDEVATSGSITAFNSFDLDGLVMLDPNGAVVEGIFLSDSGVDLTMDAFRPDFAPLLQPIPLPAGAMLLPAALGALAMFRRRRAV